MNFFIHKYIIELLSMNLQHNVLIEGIVDKLVATEGYGIVVMDEASSFFQEIKGQDTKNESNIGLLNQLYDGCGDRSIFVGGRER